jgi:hypothetical protein
VLAGGSKLAMYMILNKKTMPMEQVPRKITIRWQPKVWVTTELMKDWM